MTKRSDAVLMNIYRHLYSSFGPQHWWPAQTPFEVIVGAILTQNTNWGNVEKALRNLKGSKVLSFKALKHIPQRQLASLIKPAGYFNIKAKRLKNFIHFFDDQYKGSMALMAKEEGAALRRKLLSVNGIGEETADSIILYALHKPSFVVDAYTRRILYRHNVISHASKYGDVKNLMEKALPANVQLYNEYHALIVYLGKTYCKPKPKCESCPLRGIRYSIKYRCRRCFRAWPASSPNTRCVQCRRP